ncbi:MAG TPA: ribbon-helix-helix protein, CopG family [Kiloniellales bacterium]
MTSTAETFSVRLPDELRSEVDRLAVLTKRSRSFIVKEAVAAYVEDRRDYLKAIDEAVQEADKGIFVSGEAAFKWLDSIGTVDEKPVPQADILPE